MHTAGRFRGGEYATTKKANAEIGDPREVPSVRLILYYPQQPRCRTLAQARSGFDCFFAAPIAACGKGGRAIRAGAKRLHLVSGGLVVLKV